MNVKGLLEDQKTTINTLIKDTKKKYDKKELIALLGSIFFGTMGLLTIISMPLYGASLLGAALGCLLKKNSLDKREERELRKYDKEKKHIDKITTKGLDARREINQKRIKTINSLLEENKEKTDNYKRQRISDNLSLLGLGLSVVFTTLVPVVGIIGTGLFTAAKIYTGSKLDESHKELELNRLRANNIITDINTIKTIQNNTRNRNQTSKSRTPIKAKKQVQKTSSEVDKRNHQAVEEYLKKLTQESEKIQQKQKVKKY